MFVYLSIALNDYALIVVKFTGNSNIDFIKVNNDFDVVDVTDDLANTRIAVDC